VEEEEEDMGVLPPPSLPLILFSLFSVAGTTTYYYNTTFPDTPYKTPPLLPPHIPTPHNSELSSNAVPRTSST